MVSSNATKVSPAATVYSVQIERDRNEDINNIKSEKDASELSPSARPVANSNFNESDLERVNEFYPQPNIIKDPIITLEPSTVIFKDKISVCKNSTLAVKLPRFFKDQFPELLVKLQDEVQRLKNTIKTFIEPVHPDLLPFDVIID